MAQLFLDADAGKIGVSPTGEYILRLIIFFLDKATDLGVGPDFYPA